MSRAVLRVVLLIFLSGCSRESNQWHGRNITGVLPELTFTLTGGNGRVATAKDYTGKIVLLYFGFTHCEDVCPTTLTALSHAVSALGPDANQVRIVFVSVDPQRDTPAVLQRYATHFSPQVVALSGTDKQLEVLTRRYRAAYSHGDPDAEGNYEVYHSSAIFVFDAHGQVRLLFEQQQLNVSAVTDDLRHLINLSG